MRNDYELMVLVNAAQLTTVIDVLKDSATIISLKQIVPAEPQKNAKVKRAPQADGQPRRRADMVLLEIMKPGISYSVEDLGREIAQRGGFSPNTAHPAISILVKEGKVERHKTGFCRLIQTAA
jgi:hypothetical protein